MRVPISENPTDAQLAELAKGLQEHGIEAVPHPEGFLQLLAPTDRKRYRELSDLLLMPGGFLLCYPQCFTDSEEVKYRIANCFECNRPFAVCENCERSPDVECPYEYADGTQTCGCSVDGLMENVCRDYSLGLRFRVSFALTGVW